MTFTTTIPDPGPTGSTGTASPVGSHGLDRHRIRPGKSPATADVSDAAFLAEFEQMARHRVDDLVFLAAKDAEVDFGLGEFDAELQGEIGSGSHSLRRHAQLMTLRKKMGGVHEALRKAKR